jgi:hypothetical protein
MNPDFSKLDYNDIKQNLISFLKNQDKFSGYNFEGSTLNILLDILAYNTHYQALYNNITFNEAFLDTAQKRSSVVSIAKNLGYTPSSSRSATCIVEIVRSASDTGAIVGSLILPKYQAFKANKDSTAFFFYNLEEATFSVNELDVDGITPINYTTGSVAIREGFLRTNSFVIDGSNPTQKFTLRYKNIDTQTISIAVQNSASNATGSDAAWTESQNITLINGESNVFFLEEGPDEYYRIYFGDGILGKRLNEGNLVTITFLESSGIEANDIGFTDAESNRVFNSLDSVDTVKVVLPSFGGSEKETTNSIKYNAPKNFTTQERAVTASDYSIILQKDFAFIKSIKCWGGEENDPPAYGKVFICIKPENRAALTSSEKNAILKSLTKNRGVVGVVPELVDPNIIYLIINCDAKVDIVKNKGSITQLNAKIIKAIDDYIITNLDIFDADLIANELEASILDMDSSILSVTITPQLEYRLIPEYGAARSYTVKFQNAIQRSNSIDVPNIQSNSFTYLDYKNVVRVCKLYDDGFGLIYIGYQQDGLSYSIGRFDNLDLSVFSPESIGTIDYETGEMNLVKFNPIYSAENNTIKIFANVVDSDIFVNPNTILSIDTNDRNATVINLIESAFRKPIR